MVTVKRIVSNNNVSTASSTTSSLSSATKVRVPSSASLAMGVVGNGTSKLSEPRSREIAPPQARTFGYPRDNNNSSSSITATTPKTKPVELVSVYVRETSTSNVSDTDGHAHNPSTSINGNGNVTQNDGGVRCSNIRVCVRLRPIVVKPQRTSTPLTTTSTTKGPMIRTPGTSPNKSSTNVRKSPRVGASDRLMKPTAASTSRHQSNIHDGSHATTTMASSSSNQNRSAWDIPFRGSSSSVLEQASWTEPDRARQTSYSFDRVFGMKSTNSEVYNEAVRDVVHAAVDGYHGSVFAYGQTSTGKTFTMQGTPTEPGVIPRAVEDVFAYISASGTSSSSVDPQRPPKEREYLLRVSYLEIYNEQIYDLLVSSSSSSNPSTQTQIRIFENRQEGVVIRGLREEIVTTAAQVFHLIELGDKNRHTGSTKLNLQSSRSHSIFRIVIESRQHGHNHSGKHGIPNNNSAAEGGSLGSVSTNTTDLHGPVRVSSLSLVDLAGSESVKSTGASGQRRKEGQYINKSLMTLGHVIFKLSERQPLTPGGDNQSVPSNQRPATHKEHIPYRDSKLTRILQTSLSGNAQVCIICNISALLQNMEETTNTLKFASRAKKIVQTATVNEVDGSDENKTLLKNYREEIEALKLQLRQAKEEQERILRQKEEEERERLSQSQSQMDTTSKHGPLQKSLSQIPDEDDVDAQVLVKAIKNLETLIVSNQRLPPPPPTGVHLGEEDEGSEEDLRDDDDDDDDENADDSDDDLLHDPRQRETTTATVMTDLTTEVATSPSTPAPVNHAPVVEELHRIQGMLAKVLQSPHHRLRRNRRRSFPPTDEPTTKDLTTNVNTDDEADGASASAATMDDTLVVDLDRDEEIKSLRSKLLEQEMASNMRKADTSFLERQLEEKDFLLGDVANILSEVERRQEELEIENQKMKAELSQVRAELQMKTAELNDLKQKMNDDDEMFSDLMG